MQKRKILLGLMLGAVASASAQNLSAWPKYKNIAINTKATGANVTASVAKIPVLVRLNATNANDIFTEAAAGGADIRFGNTAGQARPFEIESWDATAKTAAIWVLADSVKGNDSTASLRVYWGASGATSASNPAAVFDTANGYSAVYHMNGKTSATENDATINAVHMSASDSVAGAIPTDTVGVIGGARVFAGNAATVEGRQYFVANNTAANPAVNQSTTNPHTVSAWVYARSISAANNHGNSIFNKGDRQFAMQIYGATGATAKLWESAIYTSTWRQAKSKGVAEAGSWFHITGTWSGSADSTGKLYVNGVLDTTIILGMGTANPVQTYNLFIGANPSSGNPVTTAPGTPRSLASGTSTNPRFWDGYLDEVSLSRTVRSADFVKLSYETQKPGASAVVLGATQTQAVSAFSVSYSPSTVTYATGVAISPASPAVVGTGVPTAYIVTPGLPAGLSLNTSNGKITGTPTAASAAANYTVRAANATDTATTVINITVVNASNENYAGTAWPNKAMIWLNTQSNGAAVTAGVSKFPVLVRLDTSNFNTGFGQAAAGGADIRFTKTNNTTRLPHQIESWDASGKKAAVWVLLDTIKGSGIDSLRMHWGNATAPNLSSGPSVFDTANGFQAVWHMNAASGNETDATTNGFNATAVSAPGTAAGVIGAARTFDGTSQFFSVPGTASGKLNFSQANSYTLSSWINPTAISEAGNTGHKIIDKGDNQYVLATYGGDAASRYWEITIKGNGSWNQCQADGSFAGSTAILASSSTNAWNHLVGTYTGGAVGSAATQRLYYNGVLVNECAITNDSPDGRTETYNVHLGVQAAGTAPGSTFSRYWNGLLDEPRLSNVARSGAWTKLEFQNQKAAQTLVAFSRPTTVTDTVVSLAGAGSQAAQNFSVRGMGQGMMFQMQNAHEGKAVLSLVDMWGRTVWTGAFAPGSTQLAWNGTVRSGVATSGIYVARLTLLNKQGKIVQVYDRKVPYTR